MRVIVVGGGDVGAHLAAQLSGDGSEVVLIDRQTSALARAEEEADVLTLAGDGTYRRVLRNAGVDRADLFVAVTGDDATNLVCASLASGLGARATVARVDAPEFYETGRGIERGVLGVDVLLCASRLISEALVRLVLHTVASKAASFAGNSVHVAMVKTEHHLAALGEPARALKLSAGVALRAVIRDGLMRDPGEINRLEVDDGLLLCGEAQALARCCRQLRELPDAPRAVIVGGGDVGQQLARTLLESGYRVQIFERSLSRCEVLAELLPLANVLHADGTSIARLRDEFVGEATLMLAVTRADEANLMASLVAANLGTEHTFALVHRPGYSDVYNHLGIRGSAGVHNVIAEAVSWLVPRDGVYAHQAIEACAHDLVEVRLPARLAPDLTLGRLAVPPGAITIALSRELQSLPMHQNQPLQGGDHLVFAVPNSSLRALLKRVDALKDGS